MTTYFAGNLWKTGNKYLGRFGVSGKGDSQAGIYKYCQE